MANKTKPSVRRVRRPSKAKAVKKTTENIAKKRVSVLKPVITCYTDGSYYGGMGTGGYCAYLECYGRSLIISGHESPTTNNRMELRAVLEALKAIETPCVFIIHSDSMYVVDTINNNRVQLWANSGWKRDGMDIKNADLWKEILQLLKKHTVYMKWVKGHAGIPGNELCDEVSRIENDLLCSHRLNDLLQIHPIPDNKSI